MNGFDLLFGKEMDYHKIWIISHSEILVDLACFVIVRYCSIHANNIMIPSKHIVNHREDLVFLIEVRFTYEQYLEYTRLLNTLVQMGYIQINFTMTPDLKYSHVVLVAADLLSENKC